MPVPTHNLSLRSRRRGTAIIWTVVMVMVMMAFTSLAVDLGRVITTKTELRRAADAAARAGVAVLSGSVTNSTVQNTVKNMAALDKANNASITVNNSDIQWGVWNAAAKTFTSSANANSSGVNAIKVTTRCTSANGNPVSLTFGTLLGASTCDVTATSIAALGTTTSTSTIFVSATSNPWLAGQTVTGTQGSIPDGGYSGPNVNSQHPWQYDLVGPIGGTAASGEGYESPVAAGLTLIPGATLQITSVSGTAANHPGGANHTADGVSGGSVSNYSDDAATTASAPGYTGASNSGIAGSEFGIANISIPIDSLLGVFLTSSNPNDGTTAPAGLDFSTQTARDYSSLSPLVKQPFYVGTGQTSSSTQQSIIVPSNATRLYFGTMDGHEWSNNTGGFNVTINQTYSAITIVQ